MKGVLRGLGVALVSTLSGCLVYDRTRIDEPIPAGDFAALQAGQELGDCLRCLGAPTHVYEYRGDGMALLWAWQDSDQWSLDVSVPLQDQLSASFDLDLGSLDAQGAMLWFGPDLRLERFRQGRLGDLLPVRTRPSVVEPEGS